MTRQSIEKYRIEITVGTIVACAVLVFTTAWSLSAQQTKVVTDVNANSREIEFCKKKSEEQAKINKAVSEALILIQSDLKHVRESLDEIKEKL